RAAAVHLVHFVHAFEAERDAILALHSAVDFSVRYAELIVPRYAAIFLAELDVRGTLQPEVVVVEVRAGCHIPRAGETHFAASLLLVLSGPRTSRQHRATRCWRS